MIAQLSPSAPRGSPSSSSIGVRCAGYFDMYSGDVVEPHTSCSSKSSPAARTKIRTLRLFTLGLRMLRVFAAIGPPSVGVLRGSVVGKGFARARGEDFDRVGEVDLGDVVVAGRLAQLVRLEQHLRMREAVRRHEAVR